MQIANGLNIEELKNNSIFLLEKDTEKNFDFLVFNYDKNSDNDLLKKLTEYFNANDNEKKLLLNSNDKENPGIKILIEKYPYGLYCVYDQCDKEKIDFALKENFLRQRICWIEKGEFLKVVDYLKSKKNNKSEINLFKTNGCNKYEFFKLWLYYKWLTHSMNNLKELNMKVDLSGSQIQLPITLPSHCFEPPESSLSDFSVCGKLNLKANFDMGKDNWISYNRHTNLAMRTFSNCFSKFLYSQGTSGAQFQYPLFNLLSLKNNYLKYNTFFSLLENALFRVGIADERFINWFESLSVENKFKMMWSGIIPVEKIRDFSYSKFKNFEINNNNKIDINDDYLKYLLEKLQINRDYEEFANIFLNDSKENNIKDLKNKFSKISILVIHQGVLDKMQIDIHKEIINLKDHFPFIIITSGRGKPENLPKGEKFLPFANLSYVMKVPPDDVIFKKIIFSITEVS